MGTSLCHGLEEFLLPQAFLEKIHMLKMPLLSSWRSTPEFKSLINELFLQRQSITEGSQSPQKPSLPTSKTGGQRSGKDFPKLIWLEAEAGLEAAVMAPRPVSLPCHNSVSPKVSLQRGGWPRAPQQSCPQGDLRRKGPLKSSLFLSPEKSYCILSC